MAKDTNTTQIHVQEKPIHPGLLEIIVHPDFHSKRLENDIKHASCFSLKHMQGLYFETYRSARDHHPPWLPQQEAGEWHCPIEDCRRTSGVPAGGEWIGFLGPNTNTMYTIALLKMAGGPLEYQPNILPICLPQHNNDLAGLVKTFRERFQGEAYKC